MLTITAEACQLIVDDAIVTFPDECCGFLFGKEDGSDRYIIISRRVENFKEGDKRRRFEISAIDYMDAEQFAEAQGLLLLGIYHSHPDHPSIPSEHDRLAAQPYFSYIIVSVSERQINSLQSWRLNEQLQFEEEIVVQTEFLNPVNK